MFVCVFWLPWSTLVLRLAVMLPQGARGPSWVFVIGLLSWRRVAVFGSLLFDDGHTDAVLGAPKILQAHANFVRVLP